MNLKKRISTIIAAIGGITIAMHIINRLITLFSTLDNKLNKEDGEIYNWRFGNVYYTKQGSGSPILLIHSLNNTSSGYEWNQVVEELAETNTVYCIDLLGCGRSEKPMITYTNFLYVQLISDFIKDEIGDTTDIITSTNSGSIATMAALYNPDTIGKIIISNPTDLGALSIAPTKRTQLFRILIKSPILGTFIYNILSNKRFIENKFVNKIYNDPSQLDELDIATFHEAAHIGGLTSKYLYASQKGRYVNTNIIPALQSINNSIFVIVSTSSPNYTTIAEQYKKHNPSLEIIGIDNTGLLPHLETPDAFVEQVKILFDL